MYEDWKLGAQGFKAWAPRQETASGLFKGLAYPAPFWYQDHGRPTAAMGSEVKLRPGRTFSSTNTFPPPFPFPFPPRPLLSTPAT
jgi:hypothetical protein